MSTIATMTAAEILDEAEDSMRNEVACAGSRRRDFIVSVCFERRDKGTTFFTVTHYDSERPLEGTIHADKAGHLTYTIEGKTVARLQSWDIEQRIDELMTAEQECKNDTWPALVEEDARAFMEVADEMAASANEASDYSLKAVSARFEVEYHFLEERYEDVQISAEDAIIRIAERAAALASEAAAAPVSDISSSQPSK